MAKIENELSEENKSPGSNSDRDSVIVIRWKCLEEGEVEERKVWTRKKREGKGKELSKKRTEEMTIDKLFKPSFLSV